MSLHYDFSAGKLCITQSAYVESILIISKMTSCSSAPTPIVDRLALPEDPPIQEEQDLMDRVPYSKILGMLIWLSTCTRFDIAFAVNRRVRTHRPHGGSQGSGPYRLPRQSVLQFREEEEAAANPLRQSSGYRYCFRGQIQQPDQAYRHPIFLLPR